MCDVGFHKIFHWSVSEQQVVKILLFDLSCSSLLIDVDGFELLLVGSFVVVVSLLFQSLKSIITLPIMCFKPTR